MIVNLSLCVSVNNNNERMMPDDTREIVQPCLDTEEFSTVEIREHFLLLHDDLIRKSKNRTIGFGKKKKQNIGFDSSR